MRGVSMNLVPRMLIPVFGMLTMLVIACGSGDDDEAALVTPAATEFPSSNVAAVVEAECFPESESKARPIMHNAPPAMVIDTDREYKAVIKLEKGGEITIELFAKETPVTVNNFVCLAREGFYDGVTFHRVLVSPPFMAQTGDPTGTGSGGPGYQFEDEFNADLRHDRPGVLSMANAGPGTNGSQFFITLAETPHLDGRHTVFGRVIEGMDVVNSIKPRDPASATTPGDAMATIVIEEN